MMIIKSLHRFYDIKKGEGILSYDPDTGVKAMHFFPPPEAIDLDPSQPDLPAWAHTGGSSEVDGKHWNGVGKIIPGEWKKSSHGDMYWLGEKGKEYRHGIDAVIKHLGHVIEDEFPDGKVPFQGQVLTASDIVGIAIQQYNKEHPDEAHHLPDENSMEWRKLTSTNFQQGLDSAGKKRALTGIEQKNRSPVKSDGGLGSLLTMNENSFKPGGTYHTDRHLESYRIPFNTHLLSVMGSLGLLSRYKIGGGSKDLPSHLKDRRGFIAPTAQGLLAPNHIRINRRLAQQHEDALGIPPQDIPHGQIHPHEILHHMPDKFFSHEKVKAGRAPNLDHNVEGMMNMASNLPPEMLDSAAFIFAGKPLTVGETLSNATTTKEWLRQVSNIGGAYPFLFGRMNQGVGKQIGDMLGGLEPGSPAALSYEDMLTHITPGGHKFVSHQKAKQGAPDVTGIWARMLMHGPSKDNPDVSAMKDAGPAVDVMGNPIDVSVNRYTAEKMAEVMAIGLGHTPKRTLGEVPLTPMAENKPIGRPEIDEFGQPVLHADIHGQNFPNHIEQFRYPNDNSGEGEIPLPSVSPAPLLSPPEPISTTTTSMRRPPPSTTGAPVASPSSVPAAGVPSPVVTTPPSLEAARSAFANASPEQVRELYQLMNPGRPVGEGRLSALERRFQSSIADPQQTQLNLSQDVFNMENRIIKMMEDLQLKDAVVDDEVLKHIPKGAFDVSSESDVKFLANSLDITTHDVRSIAVSKGDWHRIAKRYGFAPVVVKAVKVTFRGA